MPYKVFEKPARRNGPKPKPKDQLFVQIPLKLPPDVAAEFSKICVVERRTKSDMARIFVMEAMELYKAKH